MNTTLRRRGPDDEGYFLAPGIGLAMRRLSIIDLAGGHQPVGNEDGRVQVVCNGEIYNFRALRTALEARGHVISARADTAVLPHAYEEWGDAFLDRLEGMFALAVWDAGKRRLLLARDRMGKKPLYYAEWDDGIVFGSELKALLAIPGFPRTVDRRALMRYLSFEYIPAPDTILQQARKLAPATCLVWHAGRATLRRYWTPPIAQGPYLRDLDDACTTFWDLLCGAVRKRLVADVPLGVFLSGGLDSSSVVAAVRAVEPEVPLRTFAIGFSESTFDESAYAALVARHFSTEHHVERLGPDAALAILPEIVAYLDEPLADPSILPTYLLARFARQHVTVALGGDGGDEVLAGYPTFIAERLMGWYQRCPRIVRDRCLAPLVRALPVQPTYMSRELRLKKFIAGADIPLFARHTRWVGTSLSFADLGRLTGMNGPEVFADLLEDTGHNGCGVGERVQSYYLRYYLPDDVLAKVDRASMASSLEVRAPFCDHGLVEWLCRVPFHWKLCGWTTKYLLRRVMAQQLPPAICGRGKQGFAMPVAAWLRGPLRPWMEDLLHPTRLRRGGHCDPHIVARYMTEHLGGQANHQQILWSLCMFEEWQRQWL